MTLSRSEQMARIRGRDTRPELRLRDALAARGIEAQPYERTAVGRPDLLLPGARVAVFVDGCFWHGCPEHYVRPRSRTEYWSERLRSNVSRDRRQTVELEAAGWRVVRLWEHEVFADIEMATRAVAEAAAGVSRQVLSWRIEAVEVLDAAADLERQHLVDLRNPELSATRDRVRTTKKWKAPP